MKAAPADELRMSAKEFDRIMGRVLQAKPKGQAKPKAKKKKKVRK